MTAAERHTVLTIGHSNHTLEAFTALLQKHRVTAVADVRSAPYSRHNPPFNRESLAQSLKAHGIKYVFLGRQLGARPSDPSCYENGRVQYARLARTDLFLAGIERVIRGAGDQRIALMCAEREPLDCHRTLLIARVLAQRGVAVEHILPDGRLESHAATLDRLLDTPEQTNLLFSRQEQIAAALSRREQEIAYTGQQTATETL